MIMAPHGGGAQAGGTGCLLAVPGRLLIAPDQRRARMQRVGGANLKTLELRVGQFAHRLGGWISRQECSSASSLSGEAA